MSFAGAFAHIANGFSSLAGGPYWDGVVLVDGSPGHYDDDGVFVPGQPASEIPCRVQIDSASEAWRAQAGYTDRDYRFLILSSGLTVTLNTDARVKVTDPAAPTDFQAEWVVSALQRDPAAIGWAGKGRLA
jgi:hypothetical protein